MKPNQVCRFFILVSATLASVTAVTLTSNSSHLLWEGVDSVSLQCVPKEQAENIFWKLNGEALPPDDRYAITNETSPPSSTLTISPVSRKDDGAFTCVAFSGTANETSNELNLNLAWSPDTENISCSAHFYNVYTQLSCSWMGGQPAAIVTMTFNGTEQSALNNLTRDVYPDGEVTQPTLICRGYHEGGNSSCSITFERPQSPSYDNSSVTSVKQGENAVLTVDLQYGPYATFTWFHPNKDQIITEGKYKVESNGSVSRLFISDVTVAETGTYECNARSLIGSTSFLLNLDVSKVTDSAQNRLSGGEIAGIVIGVLAGVILIGVIVFFIVKK
ncbi:carcinoembryonic antigen-related cell adhesion molecule 1-like [Dendropsophus ebraccatus]|uniref:carcinoembryonic antigen-related cell adhesion molecule 1-like n=1 Tax=Dendropsophus ebraccatus TaxID=150705 RepID=UPI0038323362